MGQLIRVAAGKTVSYEEKQQDCPRVSAGRVLSYDQLKRLVFLLMLSYSPLHGGNCTVHFI